MLFTFIAPFLTALSISFFFTPFVLPIAKRLNLIDDPRKRHHPALIHKKPLPRAGGLPIYLSIVLATLIFLPKSALFIWILVAGLIVVVIGLLDDKYDLSPYFRFLGNIVSATIVVLAGVEMPFITNPIGGILYFEDINILLPKILAIVWIVWVMNMLNWSKGVDGQMPGIAVISAIIIGIAALRFPNLVDLNTQTSQLSFIVAGAALGFLVFNFYPAKIFPGYSATILGFMIGLLSIMSSVKLATAILVMGVPLVDGGLTIVRRLIKRRSPFWGDREHLHHLLLDMGLGQRSIALFYWVMSFILGVFALNLSSRGKLFAIILVVAFMTAFILSLRYLARRENA